MPRKGEVWTTTGPHRRTVVVISGNLYNELPDWPYVLTMEAINPAEVSVPAPFTIAIGENQVAQVDSIRQTAKPYFDQRLRYLDAQPLSDIHNALFRMLATN